jgi:PAS domain S-box-containing protein
LRATLDLIPAATWCANASGGLFFTNAKCADYLGLPANHTLRLGLDAGAEWDAHIPLLHPDDHESTRRIWSNCLRTASAGEVSFRVRNGHGEYRWFLRRAEPVRASDGAIQHWIGVNLDIDDTKRAETALSRSEGELRRVIDAIPTIAWCHLPDGTNEFFSKRWHEYTGLSEAESRGWGWAATYHPEDLPPLMERWRKLLASGEPGEIEARMRGKDGAYRWFLVRAEPLRDEAGNIKRWYGTKTDIDDRKRAEDAARRSEFYLREVQRLSHAGSSAHNPTTGIIHYWSPETYRIWGCDSEKPPPDKEGITQRIHPADRHRARSDYESAVQARKVYDQQYRIVRPDGTVREIHVVGHPVFGPTGELVEYISNLVDVTERRQAEKAARRSATLLAEGQRLSHTGSWGWDALTGNVTWSDELFQILGLQPQDTEPSLPLFWERVHPGDRTPLQQIFESAIRDKRDFEHEFRIIRPDSSIRHLHSVGQAVVNEANELVEFIGSAMDITDRKRSEERTQTQKEAIRLALNALVEKLDVNRFLADVITELNKQFHAKSWELWLFDEALGTLLLHSTSYSDAALSPGIESGGARPMETLQGLWQTRTAFSPPLLLQLSAEESVLTPRCRELLSARGINALMIVPLVLGEQNLGFIELHFDAPAHFTREDLELAQALANHTTLAVQLNRLTRRAEQLAVTEERNRLAREIHDTMAQAFAGIVLHAEALVASLPVNFSRSQRALSQIMKLARSGLEEARRSVQALRPKALEGRTLSEALEQTARKLAEDGKLLCQFRQRGVTQLLPPETQNELFRIAQEALTNVEKHAQAKSVWISLTYTERNIGLSIRDDGVGFAASGSKMPRHTYGLATMRERAQRIGGRLVVQSPRSGGTRIHVGVPQPKSTAL